MIEVNITDLQKNSEEYINMLTDNKSQILRKEMIKFLKENYWPNSTEYNEILEFINDFFVTPQFEIDKVQNTTKEELIKYVMKAADQCYSNDFPINKIEEWITQFFDDIDNKQIN